MTEGLERQLRILLQVEGDSSLEVRHIAVREAISTPFSVGVVARSKLPTIDLEAMVGKTASLTIMHGPKPIRLWQGVCSRAGQTDAMPPEQINALSTYELEIVPTLWLLAHRTGHRIYQRLSIPDIIDKLLAEWAIVPMWQVDRGLYPKLDYKVQHGESDYDFFSRLLEEAGIAFTFPDQGATATVLNLSDKLHVGPPRPGPPIPFRDHITRAGAAEFVEHVRLLHQVRPGAVTYRDYDLRKPTYPLFGKGVPMAPAPENKYEQYHYDAGAFLAESKAGGGGTPVADDKGIYRHDETRGTDLATRTLAALRADKRLVSFQTNVPDLSAGLVFSIEGHYHPEVASGKLLLGELSITGAPSDDWSIEGTAMFVDPTVPYRPAKKTPKPIVHGMQSATVVGPPGEEIHVDELGRVRVQFPWDREGMNNDFSSCWMRVSQGWAGTGYGMFMVPRVGQEVLIAFLDGDPDMPIVAGRVFNVKEPVPYKLPDNKTVSTWKSSTSPGGVGWNEIKYDDKAGAEIIYVQAQREMHKLVKWDEYERTLRDKRSSTVGNEQHVVKGFQRTLVEMEDHQHVKLNQLRKVDGTLSLSVGVSRQEKVGLDYALDAGSEIHLKAGMTLVIEAGMRLTIKGPGGFIDIHPAGIDISGNIVNINSGGMAGTGKGSNPLTPMDAEEAFPQDTPLG